MTVLIAGGGIAGLALALTCQQIGVPFKLFESSEQMRPLGVGINLQPSAVRELYALGLADQLDEIGIKTRDYGLYTHAGLEVWSEPRGTWAGYDYPQYSVHRGKLLMLMHDEVIRRAGEGAIHCGWRATGFDEAGELHLLNTAGETRTEKGSVVIGADGIHSAIRKQMVPDEGEPVWAGTVLWRGITRAKPFKSGASMIMAGRKGMRFVSYPISAPDPVTGLADVNWICNLHYAADADWNKEDWNRKANLQDFLPRFQDMVFDWLDVPALIEGAEQVFEYPMVDRDPLSRWSFGRATLMGDAAHAAYPVGSNGAGSAILDARHLGRAFLDHGVGPEALQSYEDKMRPATSQVVLTNRTAGPDQIIDIVQARLDARNGGGQVSDVITAQELQKHAAQYKSIAGYGVEQINAAPAIIP